MSRRFIEAGRRCGLILGVLTLLPAAAPAHDPGLSTAAIRVFPDRLESHLTFARLDVEAVIPLDADGDGSLSPEELERGRTRLAELTREAVSVHADERAIAPEQPRFHLDETNNFHFQTVFPLRAPKLVVIHSVLIDRLPSNHRQFVVLHGPDDEVLAEVLLSAEQDVMEIDVTELLGPDAVPAPRHTFRNFLWLGVEHIWIGYDHLLFLFGLLIVVPGFRPALIVITSFTVAHSITLALATLDVVHLPGRMVEPLIAATIVYVGVENLLARGGPHRRWLLTFVFGLMHGFGFAGVLRELGIASGPTGITVPLVAFNLGVELGQVAIAAVALPLIWWLRRWPAFVRYGVPAASVLVALAGAWWLLERTLLN
jgi:hypothetical protein